MMQWFTEEYDQKHFRGNVLLCCDSDNSHKNLLKSKFPECNFYTTGLEGADIIADICSNQWLKKVKDFGVKFDFVISVATLEHVTDPVEMMRNIFLLVDSCIIHSLINHPYHCHPIDCYRFMNDWPKVIGDLFGRKLKYQQFNATHFYVFFEK